MAYRPLPYPRPLIYTRFYRKISLGHPKNILSKKLFPTKSMTTLDDLTVPYSLSCGIRIRILKTVQDSDPSVQKAFIKEINQKTF